MSSDYGWVDTGYYDTWAPSYSSYEDYGWVDTGYYDTWEPTYDTYTSSSYSDSYSDYGGGYGSGSIGGGSLGYGGGAIGYSTPGYSSSVSSVYAPSNTCTAPNTCNTSYDDHSVFNAPTVVTITDNNNDTYKEEKRRGYDYYDYGYRQPVYTYQPAYYNPTPYVTLSQTPYTGLELGFWGTIAYWSFLVLWCLVAAYLIAVKKVHTRIAKRLQTFLFGDEAIVSHPAYMKNEMPAFAAVSAAIAPQLSTLAEVSRSEVPLSGTHTADTTDPFILSQINRTN